MSALDALRSEARAALSETGFLRRDRTAAALFVTDYPLRVQNAEDALARLEAGGFTVIKERGLWRIDQRRDPGFGVMDQKGVIVLQTWEGDKREHGVSCQVR